MLLHTSNGGYTSVPGNDPAGSRQPEITLFPNPVQSVLGLRLSHIDYINIEVVDLFGKVIKRLFEGECSSATMEFDVSCLPRGIYFVRISANNTIITRKFVKHGGKRAK